MKHYIALFIAAFLLYGCQDEKKNTDEKEAIENEAIKPLTFETRYYKQTSDTDCKENCPMVTIEIPEAAGRQPAADSINKRVFEVVRSIVYFGEKPYQANSYDEIMNSFMKSYKELKRDYPKETLGWEGRIKGEVSYKTDSIINIKLNNYMYTGGAHGYEGNRSLLFDPATGHSLTHRDLFNDVKGFTDYAEKQFRKKFKINDMQPINGTGFLFEDETFALPQAMFFTKEGLLLYYNTYEISSYAEGPKELLLPYKDIKQYLKRM